MRFAFPVQSILLAGLSLAACATSRQSSPPGDTGGEPQAPPVSAVLDSSRLAQALQGAATPPTDSTVSSLFVIHFAPAGTVDSVRSRVLLRRHSRPSNASAIEQAIAGHVRHQPARNAPWTYSVRTSGGSGRPVEINGAPERPPRLINASRIGLEIDMVVRRVLAGNPGYSRGARVVVIRGVVTLEGRMEAVTVARGSGDPGIDQEALLLGRFTRFQPASVADIPVPVIVMLPLTFHF